jgi:hypothetical protein
MMGGSGTRFAPAALPNAVSGRAGGISKADAQLPTRMMVLLETKGFN